MPKRKPNNALTYAKTAIKYMTKNTNRHLSNNIEVLMRDNSLSVSI